MPFILFNWFPCVLQRVRILHGLHSRFPPSHANGIAKITGTAGEIRKTATFGVDLPESEEWLTSRKSIKSQASKRKARLQVRL